MRMKILITGAFGNVGRCVLDQARARGHAVSALEVDNGRNRRLARKYGLPARTFLGDIRDADLVRRAVAGQEAVIHLAGILPPASESRRELCRSVNVDGTVSLVEALRTQAPTTSLVLISSASVMGRTQDRQPPVRAVDPVHPETFYARTKVEAEGVVAGSGLRHCVLRLSAVLPTRIPSSLGPFAEELFAIPLEARCEIVVDVDAAAACLNAAERLAAGARADRQVFFIGGGGRNGCQMRAGDMFQGILGSVGLPLPRPSLFPDARAGYSLDWYDTMDAQQALHFQNHTFDGYRGILSRKSVVVRPLLRFFRPLIVTLIERKSPRWGGKAA
jgi:nucleoside-diphosphate-sugar epimerase